MNNKKEVLIYQTQKSTTQSGVYKSSVWMMEFINYAEEENKYIFDLMNWVGGKDTLKTIKLKFDSKESAINFATKNNFEYKIVKLKNRIIKPKSYSSNFV